MYAETGLMFPYYQNFFEEVQQFDEFFISQKINASLTTISEYNLGEEGDLFKAPEPIIGQPLTNVDPVTAAISMISCGEDVISPQSLTVCDIESSIESGHLLSEVFYECRKDLLAKEGNETPLSEVLSIRVPNVKTDEKFAVLAEGSLQKSISSNCLRSMEGDLETMLKPSFLDFHVDLEAVYGMRRSFSEGDIKTLANGNNLSPIQSPLEQPKAISTCTSEDRREKLSRYRIKKSKRNFGRKIKYACRKALADSQPRIRGRFAKTEEMESPKKLQRGS